MIPIIEIKELNFGYNENLTLKNISLDINKGDFVCIIGPNGSGKSTLLKNISSILRPQKGSVTIDSNDISQYKARDLAKKMAFVPQDTNISYDFSVFDIVLMGRSPYLGRFQRESSRDFEVTKEALKLTDTLKLRDRSINEISGGERQRVVIARALAQEPEIILLDEPTSHLDINHQIEVLDLLKKLNNERDVTVVVVIHDINLAARFSSKMVLLKDGEILSVGLPKTVVTYQNMRDAYGIDMIINENTFTNSPYVIPLVNRETKANKSNGKRVHILCGGGTGSEVISMLDLEGYIVSLGVINIGDSDWEIGKRLSLEMVEELPFNEIGLEANKKNRETIEKSDILILTSVPYGRGNLKNLEAAYEALKLGKPIYLIDNYDKYEIYDYVDGRAEKLFAEMKKMGLKVVKSPEKLIDLI